MAEDSKKLESMIENLATSVAVGFSSVDKRLNNIESDLKSFKTETRESFSELNEKIDNLTDVVMENHDKRIEVLEEKVLA